MLKYGVLSGLLMSHLIADYPLQTDYLADNKHTNDFVLFFHSFLHGASALLLIYLFSGAYHLSVGFACFVLVSHFLIDAANLSLRWDQTTHLLVLFGLWVILLL